MDRAALNPNQATVVEHLFAWDDPRPPADPDAVAAIGQRLERDTAEAVSRVPAGERIFISKGALEARGCEGRYLDKLATPFAWSPAIVRGELAHRAIALDLETDRQRSPGELVAGAWELVATDPSPYGPGEFVSGMGGAEADRLRAEVRDVTVGFREHMPLLPPAATWRVEVRLRAQLHGGRMVLQGRPDLLLGRADAAVRRQMLIDFKTGGRSAAHRAHMRFYALISTLVHRVAPFRVATYYLDEGAWEAEDIDDDALEAAQRDVIGTAVQVARLTWDPPPEDQLRLEAGPACGWCGRAPDCPAAAAADRSGPLA